MIDSPIQYKAVIFDLVGTLIDSSPTLHQAMNQLLREEGRQPLDLTAIRRMFGGGSKKVLKRVHATFGETPDKAYLKRLTERLKELSSGDAAQHTTVYPGVFETLRYLSEQSVKLAVCTRRPYQQTIEVLLRTGLEGYFDVVSGGDDLALRKPNPQHLISTLETLGALPQNSVMVGDKYNDITMARDAGVAAVAVSYGFPDKAPEDFGADMLIDRFTELPGALALLSSIISQPLPESSSQSTR